MSRGAIAAGGTMLVVNAEIGGRPGLGVRVSAEEILEVGGGLAPRRGEAVLDAVGGAVIPGLHDHHVHLRGLLAARLSVDVSAAADPAAFDRMVAVAAAGAAPGGWLRVTGWSETSAGPLDRRRMDGLTGAVPARVQHRSGAMWVGGGWSRWSRSPPSAGWHAGSENSYISYMSRSLESDTYTPRPRSTSWATITLRCISLVPSPTIISGASRKYRSTSNSVE